MEKIKQSDTLKLNNEHAQWTDNSAVKIGKCTKCKGLQSFGVKYADPTFYRDFCFGCQDFRKFIYQPFLKYIAPNGSKIGYVKGGVSAACR